MELYKSGQEIWVPPPEKNGRQQKFEKKNGAQFSVLGRITYGL